jgi:hypothetical protein
VNDLIFRGRFTLKRQNKAVSIADFVNLTLIDGFWMTDCGNRANEIGSILSKFSKLSKIDDKSASVTLCMLQDKVNEAIAKDREFIISDALKIWRVDYLKLLEHISSFIRYCFAYNSLKAKKSLNKANRCLNRLEIRVNILNQFIAGNNSIGV